MKKAFTLAEVLITLGIIGVVAAISIPALITKTNEKQWNTASSVFQERLKSAIAVMNSHSTLAGHDSTLSFVEELSKHYKTNKICQNNELQNCFADIVYWGSGNAIPEEVDMTQVKLAKHFGLKDWDTELIGVQFANGVNALVAYNPLTSGDKACLQDPYSNQVDATSCVSVLYDTSGDKNPNTSGKDLRTFGVISSLGAASCVFEIGNTCYNVAPFKPSAHKWNACTSSGTSSDEADKKFMSDYGISSCCGTPGCNSNGDYWAGAVEACGGVSNMPTMANLAEIANYVYGTTDITAKSDKSGVSRDDAKLASLGFTVVAGSDVTIWPADLQSRVYSLGRKFGASSTTWFYDARNNTAPQAVCIGK